MRAPRIAALSHEHLAAAKALLQRACAFDEAHIVAEEKLFGPGAKDREAQPLGAFLGDLLIGVACSSERWLRLLAVDPGQRQQGIGSALLHACEQQIRVHSSVARIMDQPGNYLSPGIDDRNQETIAWLAKRGFAPCGQACNLRIDMQHNPRVSPERLQEGLTRCHTRGYQVSRMEATQIQSCQAWVAQHFSQGWAFELGRAAEADPKGVHLAFQVSSNPQGGPALVGFAAQGGNNQGLGSFGPTGTLEEHRGQGLGAALLLSCLIDIQATGLPFAEVAWIGPRDFYDKIAGIHSERHFTAMSKEF